jgi:hypothetical protein
MRAETQMALHAEYSTLLSNLTNVSMSASLRIEIAQREMM